MMQAIRCASKAGTSAGRMSLHRPHVYAGCTYFACHQSTTTATATTATTKTPTSNTTDGQPVAQPQRLLLWLQKPATSNATATTTATSANIDQMIKTMTQNILLPPYAIQQLLSLRDVALSQPSSSPSSPSNESNARIRMVQSVEDIVQAVNQHYHIDDETYVTSDGTTTTSTATTATISTNAMSQQQQFVGGMGEQDLGVYFVSVPTYNTSLSSFVYNDPLVTYTDLVRDGVSAVKEIRHGVPFGVYTSGIMTDIPLLDEFDIDTYEVSLFGSNPNEYDRCTTGRPRHGTKSDFHHVCHFMATATESYQVNVEAAVIQSHAKDARQLALSLGARDVHVY
jgi:hypothetical protein